MARARNIKPAFFKNYDLADLGPHVQLLFAGLWCLADREGRLEDKPRFIKAEVFPYYSVDVDGGLTLLHESGFVKRYSVNGRRLIQVEGFNKHQSPHSTEKPSELPGIEHAQPANPRQMGVTVSSPLDNVSSRKDFGGNRPDSLIPDPLIPDSPIPAHTVAPVEAAAVDNSAQQQTSDAGESEGSNGSQTHLIPEDQAPPQVAAKSSANDAAFDAAWSLYPKRSGGNNRADALKAWNARLKSGKRAADMIAGVKRYATFCMAKGNVGTEYVKQASTFFGTSLHFEEAWTLPTVAGPQGGGFMTTQERNRAISEANMRAFLEDDGVTPLDSLPAPADPYTIDME
ncbi:hypothetical protein [Caballeronia mineralivorans]|uniref:hypothetical protein n=1 Tax=Caballeronia mineralivorans TaxID=2010198 RepID=UPI00069F1921|nr:hypothetical protein [Caballeronia mineralivorans]